VQALHILAMTSLQAGLTMRSHLGAPLFFFFTSLAMGACHEFHKEYEAVHQTALWRRERPDMVREKHKMQVEIAAHEAVMNISTALQDMKTEYIGTIGVGTNSEGNAQFQARVVFDTGSTNLWVASILCKESPCDSERGKQFYDPAKSSTQELFKGESKDIDIQFGTGELKGPLHVDTYRVGPMVVKKQPFAMIRQMDGYVFSSFPFEGILGLGFKSLSFGGIQPFFDTVIDQKLLTNQEFAFYFNVDSDKPSALLWGGIDKDLYHGPIRMFPVIQPHYWALELLDFKLGNTSMAGAGMKGKPVKRVIVDSGTTYFTAPQGLHSHITRHIPGADCKKAANYPPLTFVLRGADGQTYDLVVSQATYMIGGYEDHCRPAFMALDVNEKYGPAMILGEVFMKHFFTVFSRGNGDDSDAKIGFAPANVDATPKVKAISKPSFLQTEEGSGGERRSVGVNSRARIVRRSAVHQHED